MPQRQLKPGLVSSLRYNKVSWQAQNLFTRLIGLVDDYGRFDGHPLIVSRSAFPYGDPKGRNIPEKQIQKWLEELANSRVGTEDLALISLYVVRGVPYLLLNRWTERVRAEKPRYPDPPFHQPLNFASRDVEEGYRRWQAEADVGSRQQINPPAADRNRSDHDQNRPKEEVVAHGVVEPPSDEEVFKFCEQWSGEPDSGIPKIPREFAERWLAQMAGRTRGWPVDWQRKLVADWRTGFRTWNLGKKAGGKILPQKKRERWQVEKDLAAAREQLATHPRSTWPGNKSLPDDVKKDFDALSSRRTDLEEELKACD
jgi:hypothetical protein